MSTLPRRSFVFAHLFHYLGTFFFSFSLYTRNSDPGVTKQALLFSPRPTTVSSFIFIARRQVQLFLPSSTRIGLRNVIEIGYNIGQFNAVAFYGYPSWQWIALHRDRVRVLHAFHYRGDALFGKTVFCMTGLFLNRK